MAETTAPQRIEPIVDPGPPAPVAVTPGADRVPSTGGGTDRPSTVAEQLARLEDKTARIEEKLSRSEAFTARVIDRFEASSHRMSEVAQQSELMAVRSETKFIARRIRALPGFAALVLTGVVSALVSVVLLVLIFRFAPNLLGR